MLHWGLIPAWAKEATVGRALANARAESAADKPSFRAAFRQRRCLVPADGFYEWQPPSSGTRKQPWFIRRADDGVFAIAALWERWQPAEGDAVESCALLTTSANALMQPIHDRMPVIIGAEDYATWLSPTTERNTVSALLRGWDPSDWTAVRVSTHVNAVAHDDAACITAVEGDAPPR
jgi:putative SOS response-associated peptidase YedK